MDFEDNGQLMLNDIKKELLRFKGGSVGLKKDEHSGIATINLNRPEKRNALSGEMIVQLSDAIRDLEQWPEGKGLILLSSGDCFCSGLDLNMVRELGTVQGGRGLIVFLHDTACRLQALPLVSVAVIQGKVIGGGAELVTACDFRLLTIDGEMRFVHVRMGVTTVFGGGTRLVRMLGRTEAMKLLLSGEPISAKRALELGLADGSVENSGERLEEATKWLSRYVGGDYRVVRAMKQMTLAASTKNSDESLEIERNIFLSVWGGPAHQEAIKNSGKPKL